MNKQDTLRYLNDAVIKWNTLAQTKFDPKNEFLMFSEEFTEERIATSYGDKPEIVDAIIDTLFVLLGTLHKRKIGLDIVLNMPVGDVDNIQNANSIDTLYSLGFLNKIKNNETFNASHLSEIHLFLVISLVKLEHLISESKILECFDEVIRANNDKLIPIDNNIHTEMQNAFKVGKPEGWIAPNIAAIINSQECSDTCNDNTCESQSYIDGIVNLHDLLEFTEKSYRDSTPKKRKKKKNKKQYDKK